MSEYGEPWRVASPNKVINSTGQTIASAVVSDKCRRIVACVNALSGIPNPEAVREVLDKALAFGQLPYDTPEFWAGVDSLREAIAALRR